MTGLRARSRSAAATARRRAALPLLRRSHRLFRRLPVELVEAGTARTLVVAPHMDDEVIGPGGLVAAAAAGGATIGVVVVSDGAAGRDGDDARAYTALRTDESRRACAVLGASLLDVLAFPDGSLSLHEPAIADRLAGLLVSFAPERLVVPFPTDHHRDHQAVAAATALAVRRARWGGEIWGYEAWSPLWPTVCVDITAVADTKRAALACHASQIAGLDYTEATLGLNRFRGLRVGVPYAEAFHRAPAGEWVRLCDQLVGG